jgi:hypothetical protein
MSRTWGLRRPKVPTWAFALLYPVAALAIWVGLTPPDWKVDDRIEWSSAMLDGILIAGASIGILVRCPSGSDGFLAC